MRVLNATHCCVFLSTMSLSIFALYTGTHLRTQFTSRKTLTIQLQTLRFPTLASSPIHILLLTHCSILFDRSWSSLWLTMDKVLFIIILRRLMLNLFLLYPHVLAFSYLINMWLKRFSLLLNSLFLSEGTWIRSLWRCQQVVDQAWCGAVHITECFPCHFELTKSEEILDFHLKNEVSWRNSWFLKDTEFFQISLNVSFPLRGFGLSHWAVFRNLCLSSYRRLLIFITQSVSHCSWLILVGVKMSERFVSFSL